MSVLFWRDGRLPEPLYRALPTIYLICGLAVLLSTKGFIPALSGMLLVAAALLVFSWRRDARLARATRR